MGVLLLTSRNYIFSLILLIICLLHWSERNSRIGRNPPIIVSVFVALHMLTLQVICHSLEGYGYGETGN